MKYIFYDEDMPAEMIARCRAVLPSVTDEEVLAFKAHPGSPGRILAYNKPPYWLSPHAVIVDAITDDGLRRVLSHVLGLTTDPRGVTVIDMLNECLGGGVKDITDQVIQEEAEEAMRNFGSSNV